MRPIDKICQFLGRQGFTLCAAICCIFFAFNNDIIFIYSALLMLLIGQIVTPKRINQLQNQIDQLDDYTDNQIKESIELLGKLNTKISQLEQKLKN